MVSSSIQEKKSTQNLDDSCLSTPNVIKKKEAKDWKRCSLRKGKLRRRHSTRTIKAEKPTIPPKPRLLSSAKSIVPADSQASSSKPGKPAIPPKPCLSKSKAERPIIAPKPQMQAWKSERPIVQSKSQVPSHAPEAITRPMPPVTQMCPIAVLTPMGFLIPRNFPSAILMNEGVTFTEDEHIHPDDPVQVGPSDPVAQTHDSRKRTNVSNISNELQGQLIDLFASMCKVQDSSDVSDHIKAEDFNFNVSKHTKDSAVMQNPRLALALRNILLDVQVIQIEAPEMMEMLKKKTGGHKEYKRGVHAISARLGTTRKAGEPNKIPDPNTGFRMEMYRKHFAQNTDISCRSESPTACKFKVISSAETGQETEHEVAETAELEERVLVENKSTGIKCTESEASCTRRSSFSENPSSEESQANRKDMGSSVAEKIISFSQLIQERTHGAVEAGMKTNNSKAACSNVIERKESNKSSESMHRPKNVKFGEKEKEERRFAVFSNNNLNVINANLPSLHDGIIEKIPHSLNLESENRVKRSDRIPKLVGKEDCSELKHARGNPTEVISRDSLERLSKSDEVQERARAVVEDLKRRLADTQGSTTTVAQDRNMDIWDSFSSSSSLDDEHIYEEIDEMTEVFGTKTDEDLSLHNKFSAMSKENTHHIEEEIVKASELTTTSIHSLAKASSLEKEAVMSGEEAKSKRKLQEERRDAKGGKLKSVKKGDNAGVAIKNKEKQFTSTPQQSDTSVDISSEDEESKDFCFVIGF